MALINCPECGRQVSDSASMCPNCGFGVREHFDRIKEAQASIAEFQRTHKALEPTEADWFKLFAVYDYIINRLAETTRQMAKYQTIWFDTNGIPPIPHTFCNGWFSCIEDGYVEIIKKIQNEMRNFGVPEIVENLAGLKDYQYIHAMRAMLIRWHDMVNEPFIKNTPAILQKADYRYADEVAKKSSMGYGVVTSSIATATLYAVSASIKEVEAKNSAEKNRQQYINTALSNMQQNISHLWEMHYEEFMRDVEMCHQIVMLEIGNIVFKDYLFNWKCIDEKYVNPEIQNKYQLEKKARQESAERERREKASRLKAQRAVYIENLTAQVADLKNEVTSLQAKVDEIGFALFGEKAKTKKRLQMQIEQKSSRLTQLNQTLSDAKYSPSFTNKQIVYQVNSNFNEYNSIRLRTDICSLIYDANASRSYILCNPSGVKIAVLPTQVVSVLGHYREYSAFVENRITTSIYDNGKPRIMEVYLRVTSVD